MKHEQRSYGNSNSSSRFDANLRHYHKPAPGPSTDWDDWIGDKAKGPMRTMIDNALHAAIRVASWLLATVGVLFVIYFFWSKVLPMIGK
jgi:hypothetical protein